MSDQEDLAKAVSTLDSDLKSWAAKRYGLISAGPPPKYERTWTPDDLMFAQEWDHWRGQFQNTPVTADNVDAIKSDISKWQSLAANREIELSNPNPELRDPPKDSIGSKIPWGKIALGVGVAGAAWFFLIRKPEEGLGEAVGAEEKEPLEEKVSRLMMTGTKSTRKA